MVGSQGQGSGRERKKGGKGGKNGKGDRGEEREEKKRGRWKGRRRKNEERKGGEWETDVLSCFGKPHDKISRGLLPLPHVPDIDANPCTSCISLTPDTCTYTQSSKPGGDLGWAWLDQA